MYRIRNLQIFTTFTKKVKENTGIIVYEIICLREFK